MKIWKIAQINKGDQIAQRQYDGYTDRVMRRDITMVIMMFLRVSDKGIEIYPTYNKNSNLMDLNIKVNAKIGSQFDYAKSESDNSELKERIRNICGVIPVITVVSYGKEGGDEDDRRFDKWGNRLQEILENHNVNPRYRKNYYWLLGNLPYIMQESPYLDEAMLLSGQMVGIDGSKYTKVPRMKKPKTDKDWRAIDWKKDVRELAAMYAWDHPNGTKFISKMKRKYVPWM